MSTTSWEEIKRLAADFQRVQLVESSYKLSERNCIEIINKLIGLGILNVMHTIDGKEFITDKQIEKEIYDELYVHEGRINIVQLQTLLNIDISHIESKANEIVKNDPNLNLILGQIISKDYMNKISEEINELLQERGSISLAELTNSYELPSDFIQQIIQPRVGTIIKGNFDGKILYTHFYVNTQKAILCGALEACIKPIRFSQIIKEYNLDAGMVFDIYDELISNESIKGTLYGGKQEMSAVFVPAFWAKAQQQYVDSFFKQNGYIDYGSLRKIGITEPDTYVKSLFENQTIKYLSSSCFASYFFDQVEGEIEESLNKNGFCDMSQLLPSVLNSKDANELTVFFEKKVKTVIDSVVMADVYLVNKKFLKDINTKFHAKMEQRAEEDLKKSNYILAFRTEHAIIGGQSNQAAKAESSKASKSKGKKASTATEATDESFVEITFIDKAGLVKELKAMINDLNEDLLEQFVEHFLKPLNSQYFDLLKNKIETGLQSSAKSDGQTASSVSPKKNTIKDVQEKVRMFLINIKVFEKAIKLFTDVKVQELLSKHLVKTTCSEITNEMLKFIASEQMLTFSEDNATTDARNKVIQKLKEPHKKSFTELNQALTNKTSTEIVELIEKVASESLEYSKNKNDQKREKEITIQLRENAKQSLENEKDPATVLHLSCTLLFCHSTGQMLNSPGRCVPNILEYLKADLEEDVHSKLFAFQNLVIESASKSKGEETAPIENDKINEIKSIGLDAKKYLKSSQPKS